ncbi:MAG: hypothetical protein PWQ96_190 [Clostridia bacterium]|nr:spore germination protein-like [Clostridiales bacterium]MDK2984548.1 hypothetical protein [Clostridia bacterium]
MKSTKSFKLLCLVLTIVFVLSLTGCSAVDKLKEKFNGEDEPDIVIEQSASDAENLDDQSQEVDEIGTLPPTVEETIAVDLWFAGPEGDNLVKEVREIPKVEGIARATVAELIKGPSPESNLLPTIPVGTELLDINVKDNGLIIVDFSKELVENHIGNPQAEALTVYSIVNTLCQFPTVDKVQFLVDGKYVDTIAGSIDVSTALAPNTEL